MTQKTRDELLEMSNSWYREAQRTISQIKIGREMRLETITEDAQERYHMGFATAMSAAATELSDYVLKEFKEGSDVRSV